MSATETTKQTVIDEARTMVELASKTPVEIDTMLMKLDGEIQRLADGLDSLAKRLHRLDGHKQDRYGRWCSGERVVTDQEVIDWAQAGRLLADPADVKPVLGTLTAVNERLSAVTEQFERINAEYERRPWRRYVGVPGGHIHSGIWCAGGTIKPRTLRAWAPLLSGQSVEQAIAALQTTMCTHCFPSAPVVDTLTAGGWCAGSGQSYDPEKPNRMRYAYGKTGHCRVCGSNETVSSLGNVKKHKAPTDEAPKAKPGQPANADGSPVYVAGVKASGGVRDEGNALKTMVAVSRAASSAARDLDWYGRSHPEALGWIETLNRMVPLLAADKGKTEQEVREELTKKARKANR